MASPCFKPSPDAGSFLWTFPECPVRIHVRFDLIERLQKEVLDATPPDREIGGMLVGNVLSSNGDIEVLDYVPLPSATTISKTFSMRPESLKTALQAWTGSGRVIGFYRTHL